MFARADAIAQQAIADVRRWQLAGGMTGRSTGYARLDRMTGGLQDGELWVLAGRPGMGKSALAINIALNVASALGGDSRVYIVSTEMSAAMVLRRMASLISGVPEWAIRSGDATPDQYDLFLEGLKQVAGLPLDICDAPRVSDAPNKTNRSTILGWIRSSGANPALVVVDHVSRLPDNPHQSANYRIEGIARNFKNFAMERGCPVLLLSQLSRAVEQRDDKRPVLSDLRDSGGLEQEADVVLLLYRQDYYIRDDQHPMYDNRLRGKALIDIAKNRSGPTGDILLSFDGPTMGFYE